MANNNTTLQVYGIKNCNTVKKALDWLTEHHIPFEFHDFIKEPATAEKLIAWGKHTGWEALVNKRGTTWRKLSPRAASECGRYDFRQCSAFAKQQHDQTSYCGIGK